MKKKLFGCSIEYRSVQEKEGWIRKQQDPKREKSMSILSLIDSSVLLQTKELNCWL